MVCPDSTSRSTFRLWVFVSALGWLAGAYTSSLSIIHRLALSLAIPYLHHLGSSLTGMVVGALAGFVAASVGGAGQWSILRCRAPRSGWWFPVTMIGTIIGWSLAHYLADMAGYWARSPLPMPGWMGALAPEIRLVGFITLICLGGGLTLGVMLTAGLQSMVLRHSASALTGRCWFLAAVAGAGSTIVVFVFVEFVGLFLYVMPYMHATAEFMAGLGLVRYLGAFGMAGGLIAYFTGTELFLQERGLTSTVVTEQNREVGE